VAPEVFLVQLADRFSRLIAQLLARYDSWIQEIMQQREQAMAAAAAAAAGAAGLPSQTGSGGGSAVAAAAASSGLASAPAADAAWAAALPAEECATICSDAAVVQVGLAVAAACSGAAHRGDGGCGDYMMHHSSNMHDKTDHLPRETDRMATPRDHKAHAAMSSYSRGISAKWCLLLLPHMMQVSAQ
jgi:hypothetical protein